MPSLSLALDSFPLLASATSRMPLQWNHGPMYNVLLTSGCVRISELGIQWCVLCGQPAMDMSRLPLLRFLSGMHGWSSSLVCAPAHGAFCSAVREGGREGVREGGREGVRDGGATPDALTALTLFPSQRVEVNLAETLPHSFSASFSARCLSQTANRQVTLANGPYQVSLCDLVDSKLDVVLDLDSARVYWRQHPKPLWWSVCVTLSSLFFFTRVCEHLALLVRGERRRFSAVTTLAVIVMLLLCRVLLATGVLSQHLVTSEELTLNLILEIYCCLYILAEFTTSLSLSFRRSVAAGAKHGGRLSSLHRDLEYQHLREDKEDRAGEAHAGEARAGEARAGEDRAGEAHAGEAYVGEDIRAGEELGVGEEHLAGGEHWAGGEHGACQGRASDDVSTLGALIAVQLILTAHLQNTFDNPFLGILTLLFGARAFLKFMNFMLVHTAFPRSTERDSTVAVKLFFLCVDTITLTCVLELAVRTSARSAADYASTATGMLVIVVLGGAFLHAVITGHACSLGITTKAARC